MGFSRQEYWSELPFPPPGDLPDPGLEPGFTASQALSLPSEPPGEPQLCATRGAKRFTDTLSCGHLTDHACGTVERSHCR